MVIVRSNDVFDAICKLRCVLKKRKKGALKLHFERFSLEKMHLCLSVFYFLPLNLKFNVLMLIPRKWEKNPRGHKKYIYI